VGASGQFAVKRLESTVLAVELAIFVLEVMMAALLLERMARFGGKN